MLSDSNVLVIFRPGIRGNEGYIDGLGDSVEQGIVKAVGVSNYSEKQLRDAYDLLKKRGIPLASNQVNYSLIYRNPEENDVKAARDGLGITLIAYSFYCNSSFFTLLLCTSCVLLILLIQL